MNHDEQKAAVEKMTKFLVAERGSSETNPTFAARDLGFPDHTKIHDFVREHLAHYAAWVFVSYGGKVP